jgi:hypothetical protein
MRVMPIDSYTFLNECKQEVPTILYKISEAYTNSGKDVDRMPSRKNLFFVSKNNLPEDPVFGTPDKSWKQIFF